MSSLVLTEREIRSAAAAFEGTLPHQEAPFSARNWGHGWHSLCSYQGKLKPAIAHILVKEFTQPGEVVLDPMSGAGTVPLEACLLGRRGWGNDLQELGFVLTRAKVEFGETEAAVAECESLVSWVEQTKARHSADGYADFGFNGRIPDYFHAETFREVLAARAYMAAHPVDNWARAVVYASFLHILHGNRPYALSRRSHPVTPFKPSGPTEYRDLASRLRSKVNRTLSQEWPSGARSGAAWNEDLFHLPFDREVDAVITSPPFAASTRFFIANWMRLWAAGWEPEDFVERGSAFVERRQLKSLDVYSEFFAACHRWLKPEGRLVMHVGRNSRWDMATELVPLASDWFKVVYRFDESVIGREKFGIKDQGGTTAHQYIFMVRN